MREIGDPIGAIWDGVGSGLVRAAYGFGVILAAFLVCALSSEGWPAHPLLLPAVTFGLIFKWLLLGGYAVFGIAAILGMLISLGACISGSRLKAPTASLFTFSAVYYFPIAYSGEQWYPVCIATALVWFGWFAWKPQQWEGGAGDGDEEPEAETASRDTEPAARNDGR